MPFLYMLIALFFYTFATEQYQVSGVLFVLVAVALTATYWGSFREAVREYF
ncbi:hypothetical protein [Sulfurimonas sediminis]|uniref:hypothetical protein n=1 Tax=Sulfurimonas sediminis TaxID=2590020 RepID=UPI001866DA89|nr:hypothetical protein [Sulfurimonas sediminis]